MDEEETNVEEHDKGEEKEDDVETEEERKEEIDGDEKEQQEEEDKKNKELSGLRDREEIMRDQLERENAWLGGQLKERENQLA